MTMFGRRLKERAEDVSEWVDYRPDPDFRWLTPLPMLLGIGWVYGGFVGFAVTVGLALMATLMAGVLMLAGMGFWIVANAAIDVVSTIRVPSRTSESVPRTLTPER